MTSNKGCKPQKPWFSLHSWAEFSDSGRNCPKVLFFDNQFSWMNEQVTLVQTPMYVRPLCSWMWFVITPHHKICRRQKTMKLKLCLHLSDAVVLLCHFTARSLWVRSQACSLSVQSLHVRITSVWVLRRFLWQSKNMNMRRIGNSKLVIGVSASVQGFYCHKLAFTQIQQG